MSLVVWRRRPGAARLKALRVPGGFAAAALAACLLGASIILSGGCLASGDEGERQEVAESMAKFLQSARAVISKHQSEINDPAIGDKGLSADTVIAEAAANYKKATGIDIASYDAASLRGRLLAAQIDSIREVMDANQSLINSKDVGFKGFIPATFARLVTEGFARRVGGEATIKVTAPPELVRNRKARPDAWETEVIKSRFLSPGWQRGQFYAETVTGGQGSAYRMMVPEYYAASCLSCHGTPKGSLDITGYPREGAAEHDLGGVISVTLTAQ